jgi:hypothetical protein
MKSLFWRFLAKLLARPSVADWIIKRAQRTPYDHLKVTGPSGQTYIERVPSDARLFSWEHWYMRRWWFLRLGPLQIRVHHILLADIGRDLHDHPWPFRTFILRGGYVEAREHAGGVRRRMRLPGTTAAMHRGEFHRIAKVAPGGAWTLFVTWGQRQGWGFKSPAGAVIPHEEYGA